ARHAPDLIGGSGARLRLRGEKTARNVFIPASPADACGRRAHSMREFTTCGEPLEITKMPGRPMVSKPLLTFPLSTESLMDSVPPPLLKKIAPPPSLAVLSSSRVPHRLTA